MRNINETLMAVTPFAVVARACPPSAVVSGPETVAVAKPWSAVAVRPRHGAEATGVGYAADVISTGTRSGFDRDALGGKGFIGTNGKQSKQQDQLHLMSRRDPRTWRPPA